MVHRNKRVLDATAEARARGVVPGLSLAEARSALVDGTFVEWEEEPFREANRRWLEVVAEYADAVEPLRQYEALADLTGHPRPREAAARLEKALRGVGCAPSTGLAGCRWVARLAARRGDPLGLAHSDPTGYVASVPLDSLPLTPEDAKRLGLLGHGTAHDLPRLSPDTLRTQFGKRAQGIAQAAIGRGEALVRPLPVRRSIGAEKTSRRMAYLSRRW